MPQILLAGASALALASVGGLALFYAVVLRGLPDIETLDDYRPNLITRVLDVGGNEVASFSKERRVIVPIEDVPQHVKDAFIAAEDSSFYDHEGLDYTGIVRAFIANLRSGSTRQGGSTLTQQVAKTFLLTSERTYVRKLKEAVLARRIEKHLNKNQILYLYLNQVYMGSGAYGVEAAAQTYFDKSVTGLSVAEAAMIAGVLPAPSRYSPRSNIELARRRQVFVLGRMLEDGFIDEEQYLAAREEELEVVAPEVWNEQRAANEYFVEEVRRYLVRRFGSHEVLTGGLVIHTTLDSASQRDAYLAVRKGLRDHDKRSGFRGPLGNVPEARWAEVLVQLAESNSQPSLAERGFAQGLVIEIDDDAELARLSLGPGVQTTLTLKSLAWARRPDPEIDGITPRVRRVSQALHRGDLLRLIKLGERPPEEGELSDDPNAEAQPIPIYELYQEPRAEGALIAIDLERHHLQAMIGGYGYDRSQFNRALQSRRQPGSAFKPIIYAAAMEHGHTPSSIVLDSPIVSVDGTGFQWKPENYSNKFHGPITMRQALAKSRNVATIRVLREVGLGPVHKMAKSLGIASRLEDNLGLALGNSEVSLGELVRAYTTFATGGRRIDPVFILEVRDRNGELLAAEVPLLASLEEPEEAALAEPSTPLEVFDGDIEGKDLEEFLGDIREVAYVEDTGPVLPEGYSIDPVTAYLMTDMLTAVVQSGTGHRVRALRRPVAGKTGTTNNLYDAWFVGFTPEIATGVWVGYDKARNLGKNETGSRAASPIFLDYMQHVLAGRPVVNFRYPEGIQFARIDPATGLLAPPGETYIFQPFREGTVPIEMAPRRGVGETRRVHAPRLD